MGSTAGVALDTHQTRRRRARAPPTHPGVCAECAIGRARRSASRKPPSKYLSPLQKRDCSHTNLLRHRDARAGVDMHAQIHERVRTHPSSADVRDVADVVHIARLRVASTQHEPPSNISFTHTQLQVEAHHFVQELQHVGFHALVCELSHTVLKSHRVIVPNQRPTCAMFVCSSRAKAPYLSMQISPPVLTIIAATAMPAAAHDNDQGWSGLPSARFNHVV